jgi:asparagine synthase (glutamine-hydrolysing)
LSGQTVPMCGICGVIDVDPARIAAATRRMMVAMHHRGPDDAGFELIPLGSATEGPAIGLGFRRLSILDLSPSGHQPMLNPTNGDWLVFNGEIYNFRSLRSRLMVAGSRFQSSGDTEVLLHALSLWGDRALDEIEGMFALAFYQASSKRLLLARDPVGIKPLYVAMNERHVAFASEVRAILASGYVSGEFDPAGVASFLMYGAPQDPLTVHRDIRSFPCGTRQWLRFDESTGRIATESPKRFWRFPAPLPDLTEAVALRETRATLEAAVENHLAADVETGFFLSAGVDSTVIATLAARAVGQISTFTVGFESSSMASEVDAAAQTARAIGSRHTEIMIRADSIRDWWDGWLQSADRPCVDGLNSYIISGALKRAGATVAFSGLGADELFGGYANFRRVRQLSPVLRSMAYLPARSRKAAVNAMLGLFPRRYHSRIKNLAGNSGRCIDLAIELKQFLPASSVEALGLPAREVGLNDDYIPDAAHDFLDDVGDDVFLAVSRVETYLYMSNTLLRDADATSMAHSVELRVPFVSRPVLEAAGRIPGRLHSGRRKGPKHLLRKATADLMPAHVLRRPKTGFTLPVNDWMFGELRESCEAAVAAVERLPFLDSSAVRSTWKRFVTERDHCYWMKPMLLVALGSYINTCRAGGA